MWWQSVRVSCCVRVCGPGCACLHACLCECACTLLCVWGCEKPSVWSLRAVLAWCSDHEAWMLTSCVLSSSETQAEGLAPARRLHPGPVDPHPAHLLQDLRHQTPQAHLLSGKETLWRTGGANWAGKAVRSTTSPLALFLWGGVQAESWGSHGNTWITFMNCSVLFLLFLLWLQLWLLFRVTLHCNYLISVWNWGCVWCFSLTTLLSATVSFHPFLNLSECTRCTF